MNEVDLAIVRAKLAQLLSAWSYVPIGGDTGWEDDVIPGLYLPLRLWRELAKVIADL